jgi:hypothetical protein
VVADPDDAARRFLGAIKSNLARTPPALAFRVVASDPLDEAAPPRVDWEPAPAVGVDVEALMTAARDRDEPTDRQDADAFLRELLPTGPVASKDIFRAAKANGISRATLFRAKKRLGIPARRAGGFAAEGEWQWWPPSKESREASYESHTAPRETLSANRDDIGKSDADFAYESHSTEHETHSATGETGPDAAASDWAEV